MNTIVLLILVLGVLGLLFQKKEEETSSLTYNARFGNEEDYLSSSHTGFAVTGDKAITKELSYSNCFLSGPTSAGKSSVVVYNSIATISKGRSSLVVNDVNGELERCRHYLERRGYQFLRIDPSDASRSESINFLQLAKNVPESNKIAQIMGSSREGKSSSDPFWENSVVNLCGLVFRLQRFHLPIEYCTFQNSLRIIEKLAVDGNAVSKLFLRAKDPSLMEAYKATLVMGERTLQSVIASARVALQMFTDPEVCRMTATNSIDFQQLRERPTALFIRTPLKDLKYYKPLSTLFFQTLFDFVLSRIPEKRERDIFFLIDEFSSFKFPDIGLTISNIRKTQAGILLCVQEEQALVAQYGQATAQQIRTNCATQVFMRGQQLAECKNLAQILGRYSLVDDETGREKGCRELMTPDEIRQTDDSIILITNKPPLKCKPVPYYENFWRNGLVEKHPKPYPQREVPDPPLLPFD